jgi:transposase
MIPRVTDDLWERFSVHLPPHKVSRKGGRPPRDDRNCLDAIIFILRTGTQWQMLPAKEFGVSGSTCWRRFDAWSKCGVWSDTHQALLNELGLSGRIDLSAAVIDSASVRAVFGGPNPTDRAKNGCKRHVISDAGGIPLLVHTTPANVRDDLPAVEMVKSMPAIKQRRGRPRKKPTEMIGDRGYGFPHIIAPIVAMGIATLLCLRGSPHGSGLGKRRYVIERTLSWLGDFRRLKLCYERTGQHFQAFNELALCLVCANKLALTV